MGGSIVENTVIALLSQIDVLNKASCHIKHLISFFLVPFKSIASADISVAREKHLVN